jgi:hypothetical protein
MSCVVLVYCGCGARVARIAVRRGITFIHGATIALSRGVVDRAATFADDCLASYRLWERRSARNIYGDVEVAICLQMAGIFPRKARSCLFHGWLFVHRSGLSQGRLAEVERPR